MTRSGWVVLAIALAFGASGIGLHTPALVLVSAAALAALAASGLGVFVHPRLALARTVGQTRVSVGDDLEVELQVTNGRSRPSIPTTATQPFGPTIVSVAIPGVPGHSSRTLTYRLSAGRRGVFPLAPLAVTRADPLGLVRARVVATEDEIILWVHPRTHPASPLPSGRRLAEEGPSGGGVRQGGLVFQSLREYVVGDDVRHIHWRSTAHAGELMVREHLELTIPEGVVLIDTRADVHSASSFEEVVEAAASVVLASMQAGVRVLLASTGGLVVRPVVPDDALDALAELQLDAELPAPGGGRAGASGLSPTGDTLDSIGSAGGALLLLTGSGRPGDATEVARLCGRFAEVTTVQIHEAVSTDLGGVGARNVRVAGALEFIAFWNQAQQ